MKSDYGWALRFGKKLESDWGSKLSLLGICAVCTPKSNKDPVVRTALFPTRREAAQWLKAERARKGEWSRKNYYRGMRPVRVRVTIEETK